MNKHTNLIRMLRSWVIELAVIAAAVSANSAAASVTPGVRVNTDYIDARISLDYPGFEGLSVDSLGKQHFPLVAMKPPAGPWRPVRATRRGSRVEYLSAGALPSAPPRWAIEIATNTILLESHWSVEDPPEPLVLDADARSCHVTLLGLLESNGSIRLPALLHFPGQGTFRISASVEPAEPLGYTTTRKESRITFPGATREHPTLIYRLQVVAIHPEIPGIAADARFDGFRRNWLNIFQVNPQRRVLSNNAGSDSCGYCYYEYGDIAKLTPPLAKGLTALDMVRQTLDRVIAGAIVCGMPGYTRGRPEDHPCRLHELCPGSARQSYSRSQKGLRGSSSPFRRGNKSGWLRRLPNL